MACYFVESDSLITLQSVHTPTKQLILTRLETTKARQQELLEESEAKGYGPSVVYGVDDFNPHMKCNWDVLHHPK